MGTRVWSAFVAAALVLGALLAMPGSAVVSPPQAQAAPCPVASTSLDGFGVLTMQGTPPCIYDPETLIPSCRSGHVWFEEDVNYVVQDPYDTGIVCNAVKGIVLNGGDGDDILDMSGVSAAAGFGAINQANQLNGGYGPDTLIGGPMTAGLNGGPDNDIVLARNGVPDLVSCGDGTDAVQSDMAGVDTLIGCEVQDLTPTPVVTPPPTKTGKRAAAVKRCKRKYRAGTKGRRKCIRHAQTLPV